jgi:hypothetical protein
MIYDFLDQKTRPSIKIRQHDKAKLHHDGVVLH